MSFQSRGFFIHIVSIKLFVMRVVFVCLILLNTCNKDPVNFLILRKRRSRRLWLAVSHVMTFAGGAAVFRCSAHVWFLINHPLAHPLAHPGPSPHMDIGPKI